MDERFGAIALCALGLEKTLTNEIGKIGLETTGRAPGRVYFEAEAAGLFRANLELRTAERVLLEAARFRAPDFDALFEGARRPAWERFFARDDKLVIERVRSRDSKLEAQTSIQSVVHKAIYESLGKKYRIERLPETGRTRSLRVYLEDDDCILGLDLSGEALHRRGWRKSAGEAPLKETIAAGLLLMAGWRRRLPLLDPFCGAGTILIEAAHFAMDRAPGLDRHFDLETMPIAKEGHAAAFTTERQRARDAVRKDADFLLVGRDADPQAVDFARANAERAGVGPLIDFAVGKAEDVRPLAEKGILLTNPPWGERLGTEEESRALYGSLGEAWGIRASSGSSLFSGWGLGFIINRSDFGQDFGRRAPIERALVNGAEEHWFHWYPAGWEKEPERQERHRKPSVGPDKAATAGKGAKRPPRATGERPARTEGWKPAREEGGRPPRSEGWKPSHSSAVRPGRSEGWKPSHSPAERPARREGWKPARASGEKPGRMEGWKPAREEGGRPPRSEGWKPPRSSGERPGRSEGWKPSHSSAERPAGREGWKPNHGTGGDSARPEGARTPRAEGGRSPRPSSERSPRPEGGQPPRPEGRRSRRSEGGPPPRSGGPGAPRS